MRSEVIEIIIFSCLVVALGIAWYIGWVVPRHEFLHAVMDCMTEIGDHSEAGYKICAETVSRN